MTLKNRIVAALVGFGALCGTLPAAAHAQLGGCLDLYEIASLEEGNSNRGVEIKKAMGLILEARFAFANTGWIGAAGTEMRRVMDVLKRTCPQAQRDEVAAILVAGNERLTYCSSGATSKADFVNLYTRQDLMDFVVSRYWDEYRSRCQGK